MPLIPLPTKAPVTPDAPKPVLDREKRPTVNNAGVRQAVGQLGGIKTDELPGKELTAPLRALGAIGDAIAQTGSVIGALAAKRQEAITDKQVAEADGQMSAAYADHEAWKSQNNPDPLKWREDLQRRMGELRAKINERTDLTGGAKTAIDLRLTRNEAQFLTQTQLASDKQIFADAKSGFIASAESNLDAQNAEGFEAAITTGEKKGYFRPHEVQNFRERFKYTAERRAKEATAQKEADDFTLLSNEAITDPRKWKAENGTPWKGDETRWQRVKNIADAREREVTGEAAGSLSDAIIEGNVTVDAQVDAWSDSLTPKIRAEAKELLRSQNSAAMIQDRETNGVRNAVELRQAVKDYDPENDPDGAQYFGLKAQIKARIPSGLGNEVSNVLDGKYTGKPGSLPVRPEVQRNITATLDKMFDPKYGVIRWKSDQWVEAPKDPMGKEKKWKMATVADPAAQQRAINAQTQIEEKLNDWIRANPQEATDVNKVQKKIMELLPEGTRAGALDTLKKLNTPKAGTSLNLRGFVDPPDLKDKLPAGLRAHAQDFIDAGKEYGLNPRVLAAIASLETGGGTSRAFREKNNAMGISDDKGPRSMASVRESIFRQAKTLANPSGPYAKARTLDEFGSIYAPPGASNDFHGTNSGWAEGVRAYLARL